MLFPATIYKYSWYNSVVREKNDPSEYNTQPIIAIPHHKRIKLDQIMKVLFRLSDRLTIELINYLFDEQFTVETATIHETNTESFDDGYDRIIADLCVVVTTNRQTYRYHIEFQTNNDTLMAVRMFRYGFESAMNQLKVESHHEVPPLIKFPRQLVIYIEKNRNIRDQLSLNLQLPNGKVIPYEVPVMKYWEYTPEELEAKNMYSLLPLQVFKFRKSIQAIEDSSKTVSEKRILIIEQFRQLKDTIRHLTEILARLRKEQKLVGEDLTKVLNAINYLNEFLYRRYGEYETIEKEAVRMLKTLHDPEVYEQGMEKGMEQGSRNKAFDVARNLLALNIEVDKIAIATGLSESEILRLK